MTDISVVGLGVMGRALSCALLKKGYSLTVWNRSKEKAEELILLGAILANSAREAIVSSEVTIICVASHVQSIEILNHCRGSLKDKIIIELSTGNATDAEYLAKLVSNNQANWLIGIINAFPAAIGKSETVLMMVGEHKTWQKGYDIIKTLGGNSIHIGTQAGMLATLFAALFTIRQGFMFGMIYGGVICKKAGIPLAIYAEQIPVSLAVLPSQHQLFSDTVVRGNYDNPPAAMKTYKQALENALSTYKANDAPSEMLQLFSNLVDLGLEAELGDQALTSLVELLGNQEFDTKLEKNESLICNNTATR